MIQATQKERAAVLWAASKGFNKVAADQLCRRLGHKAVMAICAEKPGRIKVLAAEALFERLEHVAEGTEDNGDHRFAWPEAGPQEIEGWHRPRCGPVYTAWSCDQDGNPIWWQGEFATDAEAGEHAGGFPNGGIVQGPDGKWDYGFGWAESPEAAVALGEEYYPRHGD